MKKIRVEDAVGQTICHDITEMRDGFKGAAFTRGHVIRKEDIEKLLDIGKRHVYVYEEAAGEIHEETAAIRMAAACRTEFTSDSKPSEGKVVRTAEGDGMYRIDTKLLEELNAIDDVTVSSLPDHYPVKAGMKIASMRIVPLMTDEGNIEAFERLCAGSTLMKILPYTERKAGVIITGSEVYTGRIKDKFEPVVREKLSAYPARILGVTVTDDDTEMIVGAAKTFLGQGADLLIFAGGMSVDPDDVTPEAIAKLGAGIVSYGAPAQPGNMTLAAYLGDCAILGVPGAAISLPTTLFDVLLPQMFTGEKLTKEDLIRLGNGGLCQRCTTCHFPNCTFGRY